MNKTMKIKLSVFLLILILCASGAVAGVSNENKNEVGQQQSNQNNLSLGDNYGAPEMINPTKLDSNINAALNPYLDKDDNWGYWTPDNKQILSDKQIEVLRNSSWNLERQVKFWQTHERESDGVYILPQKITGYDTVSEMGYVLVIANEPVILESLVCEALHLAVKEGKIRNAVVLVRGKFITVGKVKSLGGFAGGGSPIGAETDINKIVVSGAIGSGIGTSKSWVDKGFEVKIISYDHIPADYFALLKTKEKDMAAAKPVNTETKPPATNFDTDEHIIKDRLSEYPEKQNQIKTVNDVATGIYKDWPVLTANGILIYFMGGADERGTEAYNAYLGLKRGKEVALAVSKILVEKYGLNVEEVVKIIKYASTGENHPVSNEYKKNRVVYMVRGEIISILN